MSSPKPINLHGQVAERLALLILGGRYRPGQTLPIENDLCAEFSVSRTTIRGVVKELAGKGLLDVGPSRGTRVRPKPAWNLLDSDMMRWRIHLGVDRKLIQDIYEMRECFEPRAASLAAERGTAAEHRAIVETFATLSITREEGGERSAAADVAFHTAILLGAGNEFIASFASTVSMMLRASFEIARWRQLLSEHDLEQHRAIRDAVLAHDGRLAFAATELLLVSSKTVQMAAVEELGHKAGLGDGQNSFY